MFVHPQHDFCVGIRVERMTARFEDCSLTSKVVGLTVVDNPDRPIVISEWLVAGGTGVDDREARHAERDVFVVEHALVVRSSMFHSRNHHGDSLRPAAAPDSTDSTHDRISRDQKESGDTEYLGC